MNRTRSTNINPIDYEEQQVRQMQREPLFPRSNDNHFQHSNPQTVYWLDVNVVLPDDGILVLVALVNSNEPVWLGYFDGERWCDCDGMPVEVSHWMPLPQSPVQLPEVPVRKEK